MKQYHDLLQTILDKGVKKEDRTGTGTISYFGYQMRFDLSQGFPLLTTKKMATKAIISELLWFLEGSTDERRLAEIHYGLPREELIGKNTIWTANADNQGKKLGHTNNDLVKELGPIYSANWRNFDNKVDQIQDVIESIKNNPDSRRHIVSSWNPTTIDNVALPSCHTMFQFYVANGKLSCQLYQRSGDVFLGIPFNIASYALLTMMIAQVCNLEVGEFIHTIGDAHIYNNHLEQVNEQLSRDYNKYSLPTMKINPNITDINDFKMDDFELIGYTSYPTIKAPMAV